MKIHSIKFKITLLLVVTVTCLVAMLIGFNSIFSEKVYMNRKQYLDQLAAVFILQGYLDSLSC